MKSFGKRPELRCTCSFTQLAYAAAVVGVGVYLLALTFWLPEPPEKLPE